MKGNETQYETKCAQILTYKYLRSLPLDCGWCSVQHRIFYGKQVCGAESRASSLGFPLSSNAISFVPP